MELYIPVDDLGLYGVTGEQLLGTGEFEFDGEGYIFTGEWIDEGPDPGGNGLPDVLDKLMGVDFSENPSHDNIGG